MNRKRPYTNDFLYSYSSEHLAYEIEMFFSSVIFLNPDSDFIANTSSDAKKINYAVIESFGIHCRNLIDFFYKDKPRPTDIAAEDYCDNWKTIRPEDTDDFFENLRNRVNKELGHLTSSRIDGKPENKAWDIESAEIRMKQILRKFSSNASSVKLSTKVIQLIHRYAG